VDRATHATLQSAAERALGHGAGVDSAQAVTGGCIHACYRLTSGAAQLFVKLNAARFADAFAAEADGLEALRAAGLRAPEPLAHGASGGRAFLALEWLELRDRGDFAALGRALAELHRRTGASFGWRRDNYIGATPQDNGELSDWIEFWRVRRLAPQLALAEVHGHGAALLNDLALLMEKLPALFADYMPLASLLHGDLWRGNGGFLADGSPVVFDPAVYRGDRETDLAMTELFGGFPPDFYAAYREAWPLEPGYATRKHLYNLYHLLNHLNLFGGGYLGQVRAVLGLLLHAL
jgi:protein-ribulosamine 3-kinase